MKHLLIACLIAAAATATSAQTRTALRVIREDGALVLTEGGSFYRFKRDSSCDSGPIRAIAGEAAAVVVKLGEEYLFQYLRR